jgi:branched-chain amino acid transport system substrate-binding protein
MSSTRRPDGASGGEEKFVRLHREGERHRSLRWVLLSLLAVVVLTATACGSDNNNSSSTSSTGTGSSGTAKKSTAPLVIANLEGPAADGGPDFTTGMLVAQKQINDAGGVDGRKIEIKTFKKGLTPQESLQAYRDASGDSAVLSAWLGGGGGNALKAQADRVKLPFFSANGVTSFYTPPNPYGFSLSLGGEYATSSLVQVMKNNPNVKKIGVLHFETDFSNGLTPALKDRCKELGCEVVTEQTAAIDASVDALVPQLTKLKNSGADAYYIECLNPNAAKAAVQLGMDNKPRMCEQWQAVPAIAAAAGKAGEGVIFGGHKCVGGDQIAAGDPTREWCADYVKKWQAMFPDKKDSFSNYSVYGDDAVTIFADAAGKLIKAGKEVNRENLRAQYEKYDGKGLRTSHGLITSSPTDHLLTGTWHEAYANYTTKMNGKVPTYVLAPGADPTGATP